ncbi:MAG: hypothetical protein R3B09_17210 [Nannocystaceae bacterium]
MRATSLLALVLLSAIACGDDVSTSAASTSAGDETTGSLEPHATFEASVDQLGLCGVIGSKNLILKATRVGCVGSPPAPCTLPTDPYKAWVGEVATCPSASTSAVMRVEVPMSGRFHVQVDVTTESGAVSHCFGVDGEALLEVTDADLEARRGIGVIDLGGPCPEP